MKTYNFIAIITCMIVLSNSCLKENTSTNPKPIVKIDSISFSRNIKPMLTGNCSDPNCHNGMDDYTNLIAMPKPLVVT